jgi:peroxiredoxin
VLLQFSRGDWCPVCHVMMRVLKREAARLKDNNIVVVMISATEGADAEEFVRELGLPYRILRDPSCVTAKAYGAFDATAFGGKGGHLPATFVVAPDGTLALSSRSDDVASFLDPSEVLRLLEQPAAA